MPQAQEVKPGAPEKQPEQTQVTPPVEKPTESERIETISRIRKMATTAHQPIPAEQSEEEKKKAAEAEEKKKAEAGKLEKEKAAAAEVPEGDKGASKPAPVKRVIKRAKGYEEAPGAVTAAADKLADAAAKLATAAEKVAPPQKPAEKPTEKQLKLSSAEERYLKAMEVLPELFPDKEQYKDIAARARQFLSELPEFEEKFDASFRSKWERQNADKFEDDAEREAAFKEARDEAFAGESDRFKAKFRIDYDDDDLIEARVELRARPIEEKAKVAHNAAATVAEEKRVESVIPIAKNAKVSAVEDIRANIAETLGPEYKGLIGDNGKLDDKVVASISDSDIVSEIVQDGLNRAQNFAEAVTLAFSGVNTPLIDQVYQFCVAQEESLKGTKDEDGREFVPRMEFIKMNKQQRAEAWTLEPEMVIAMANDAIMGGVKTKIAAEREVLSKRIEKRGLAASKPAPAKVVKPSAPSSVDHIPATTQKSGGSQSSMLSMFRGR